MDEDDGQKAADYITQKQEDEYYERLAYEMEKHDRISGFFIQGCVLIIFVLIIVAALYFGAN